MFPQSKFSRAFLHPRYWLTWFGVGILWLLVQLPYPVLRFLGTRTGKLARPFLKRRESIAQKNIELCFPTLSREEREKLIAENFHSLGMALLETGMAWFWPDSRVSQMV
ncbi:Protein Ddg [Salmonella enterica subsp. enterica]|uniref:Protein Ddg n=1 Tax=Salmonella enterica I TaxID=59201 RepID=A0A447TYS3_SALET|nr:Protein Ddg [Salmonella enterica subsp. enterica]